MDRMRQRGITEEQVAEALRNAHTSFEDRPQRSKCFIGSVDGRDLKVWVVWPITRPDGAAIVKSTAWKGEE